MSTAILANSPMPMQPDDPPVTPASIAAAQRSALAELREAAQSIAASRGHALGKWRETNEIDVEVAFCSRCWRSAAIDVLRDPHLAGPALSDRCAPQRSRRPDAFLAHQHETAMTRGASR